MIIYRTGISQIQTECGMRLNDLYACKKKKWLELGSTTTNSWSSQEETLDIKPHKDLKVVE